MGLGVRELFDNNIKVHFAGSDGGEIFYAALLAAQTKYRLFSCYKYILKCRPDDDFRLPADHVIRVQDTVNRHVIQDSGLFTLMFGAGKGQYLLKACLALLDTPFFYFFTRNADRR